MKLITYAVVLGCLAACQVYAQNTEALSEPPVSINVEQIAKEPKRVSPAKEQQVALVNIRLRYSDGDFKSAELISSERIRSIAPKVFARQSGDWQVFILGEGDTRSFYVQNPGYLEAEGESDNKPYVYVESDDIVDWPLIVPLYVNGEDIGASSIRIVDSKNESVIFETKI